MIATFYCVFTSFIKMPQQNILFLTYWERNLENSVYFFVHKVFFSFALFHMLSSSISSATVVSIGSVEGEISLKVSSLGN